MYQRGYLISPNSMICVVIMLSFPILTPKISSKPRATHIGCLRCKKSLINLSATNFSILFLGPYDRPIIGNKWIFKNKLDESANIIRNKARLVAQSYTQIEEIDFETFVPIAWLEAIRMTLAFTSFKDF